MSIKLLKGLKSNKKSNTKGKGKAQKDITKREIIKSWVRTLIIAVAVLVAIIMGAVLSLDKFTRHSERFILPDFSNMTVIEADTANGEMNIRFDIIDSLYVEQAKPGVILDQYPKAGSFIKSGRRVTVTISTTSPRKVKLPYVTGFSLRQALSSLQRDNIVVSQLIYVDDIATNNIIKQEFEGVEVTADTDIEVPINSKVTLYVGLGDKAPSLYAPNVIGEEIKGVRGILTSEGLNMDVVVDSTVTAINHIRSRVFSQSPLPDDSVGYGNAITLYITNDEAKLELFSREYKNIINSEKSLTEMYEKMVEKKLNDSMLFLTNRAAIFTPQNKLKRINEAIPQELYELFISINNSSSIDNVKAQLDTIIIKKDFLQRGEIFTKQEQTNNEL